MKTIITVLFLTVSLFVNAQIANITYITVPRENSEEFLKLHEKFTNLSLSEERKLEQSVIFAHSFAGDYTFAIYDLYTNAEDMVGDAAIAEKVMDKNIEAMKLSKEQKEAMMKSFKTYSGMYAYNHSDQVRTSQWTKDLRYEAKNIDWTSKKIVVVSKYEVKFKMNKTFKDGLINCSIKNLKESGLCELHFATQHLYGSGADFHTYQFYNSWTDFAAFEEGNLGGEMTNEDKTFWSSIEAHEDEILTLIGAINPDTKLFTYKK
jgi:hypothetical protein